MTLPRMVTGRHISDLDKVDNASFDHLVLYPVSWSIASKNLGSWDRDCQENRHWYAPYCSLELWLLCPWWQHVQPSPCRGGISAFPEQQRPPAWSPPRPSPRWPRRSLRTAASSSGQRGTEKRDPLQPTWVLDASPATRIVEEPTSTRTITWTIRESMLIWSSKMAVTTEMRKSARNLVIIFNPWHLFKLCTFLDGASQSGRRSRDLVLPTSGSCSPSANRVALDPQQSMLATSISSSVKALPWVLTNSTTASRSPSPEQMGWQRILAFPWKIPNVIFTF